MTTPFFPEVTAMWKEATIENDEIPARAFLDAAAKFIPMFDRLGKIFYALKADVGGNVDKLYKALEADPQPTLQKLVINDKLAGREKNKNSAAVALLWFKRAMDFVFTLLQKVSQGVDGNKAAKEAYAETLSQFHGFVVKKAFDVGLLAAPSTETMASCLGTSKESVIAEMTEWVQVASPLLENIAAFLIKEGLDDQSKV